MNKTFSNYKLSSIEFTKILAKRIFIVSLPLMITGSVNAAGNNFDYDTNFERTSQPKLLITINLEDVTPDHDYYSRREHEQNMSSKLPQTIIEEQLEAQKQTQSKRKMQKELDNLRKKRRKESTKKISQNSKKFTINKIIKEKK